MTQPLGIRLPKEILEKIEKLGKNEMLDRSTILRKLILLGYSELIKKNAAESYIRGSITLSEAANNAGLCLFDMEKYLVENGFKSDYSIEDLEREFKNLK